MSAEANRITIISTGGTIEKTYDSNHGHLRNQENVLDLMLERLELPGVEIQCVTLMNKDSLDMTEEDHRVIVKAVMDAAPEADSIIVVHGTDRLVETGNHLLAEFGDQPDVPVILTGAMRPFELRRSDSMQNLTEALLAGQLLGPGIYCVMHNRVLRFPGVKKDRESMTFVQDADS